jgi:hypothetical protein
VLVSFASLGLSLLLEEEEEEEEEVVLPILLPLHVHAAALHSLTRVDQALRQEFHHKLLLLSPQMRRRVVV